MLSQLAEIAIGHPPILFCLLAKMKKKLKIIKQCKKHSERLINHHKRFFFGKKNNYDIFELMKKKKSFFKKKNVSF